MHIGLISIFFILHFLNISFFLLKVHKRLFTLSRKKTDTGYYTTYTALIKPLRRGKQLMNAYKLLSQFVYLESHVALTLYCMFVEVNRRHYTASSRFCVAKSNICLINMFTAFSGLLTEMKSILLDWDKPKYNLQLFQD